MDNNSISDLFEQVADVINAGAWVWDIETGKEWWSPKYYELLGYSPGDIFPDVYTFRNVLLHPDDKEALQLAVEDYFKKGKPYFLNIRLKTKCGEYLWFETSGKAQFVDGKPINMYGCIINRNESKKAQLALEKNKQLLDETNAMGKIGGWEYFAETGEINWSDEVYHIYETERNIKLTTEFVSSFYPEGMKRTLENAAEKTLTDGHQYDLEVPAVSGKGNHKWLRAIGKPIINKEGKVIGVRGTVQDITSSKLKEDEIKRYRILLDEANRLGKLGAWEIDAGTLKGLWTKGMYDIHELPYNLEISDELVRELLHEGFYEIRQAIGNCIEKKKPYDLIIKVKTYNDKQKWARVIGIPVTDPDDNVVAIRGFTQDIDEQMHREAELKQSIKIITDQNNRLNNFAHIVSHNLRNHASNIQMLLALANDFQDEGDRKEIFGQFSKISKSLNQTITHLNDIVKIQASLNVSRSLLFFDEVLNNVKNLLSPAIKETGAQILSDFSGCGSIEYVPAYLESILLNLISNGIKYRSPFRAPIIDVKTFFRDDKKLLSVTDNGLGINMERHAANVFGMYKTFHSNPDAQGIGLFMTKNQVESLGGNISVTSTLYEGSIFTVQF